jgi:hypothetical protein
MIYLALASLKHHGRCARFASWFQWLSTETCMYCWFRTHKAGIFRSYSRGTNDVMREQANRLENAINPWLRTLQKKRRKKKRKKGGRSRGAARAPRGNQRKKLCATKAQSTPTAQPAGYPTFIPNSPLHSTPLRSPLQLLRIHIALFVQVLSVSKCRSSTFVRNPMCPPRSQRPHDL